MDVRVIALVSLLFVVAAPLAAQTSNPFTTRPVTSAPAATQAAPDPDRPYFGDEPIPALPPVPHPATATAPVEPAREPEIDPSVRRQYDAGMDLLAKGELLQSRAQLSEAFFSGKLDAARQKKALDALTDLAEQTLFSHKVVEGDPYTGTCQVGRGDTIQRIAEREKLLIHPSFIARVSGADPAKLKVGQTLKLVYGPAHAVVDKSHFTMDLYLQREGKPKAFVKRLKVGLGKDGCTPEGAWQVVKKAPHAKWTPPPSATGGGSIAWGEPGYPLGKEGYWISLQGTDDNTRARTGYGLHGTNDPDSIGKAASTGCVRLADEDIELVYGLLSERGSTVTVRK